MYFAKIRILQFFHDETESRTVRIEATNNTYSNPVKLHNIKRSQQ